MTDPAPRPLYRPMRARDPSEPRSQTALELLFDLAFSAAAGFAAVQVAGTLRGGGWGEAGLGFAMVFFAIWWAWLNVSRFASAYDPDDGVTWVLTTVQILGAATLAAGVPVAVTERDFTVITIGYAVMRLPLAAQWLRAAAGDPVRRATCLRYAAGLVVLQVAWLARLAVPDRWLLPGFLLLAAAELAVPWWSERRGRILTNPAHLAGRYGRFTLTVAAQVVAATVLSIRLGVDDAAARLPLVAVAVVSLGMVVCLLWLYFAVPHARLSAGRVAARWEYGHYPLVGAIGAMGAGARFLAETIAGTGGGADTDGRWAAYPQLVPAAVAVATLWWVCVLPADRPAANRTGRPPWHLRYPACAALVVLTPLAFPAAPLAATTIALALLVALAATGRPRSAAG